MNRKPNVATHFDRRSNDHPTRRTPPYGWRDDNGVPVWAIDKNGTPVCGKTGSTSKKQCQQTRVCANGRCALKTHGGQSPGALIKHGTRSELLRRLGLGAKLDAIENDEELRSHRDNIRLYELAIQNDLEAGVPTGEEWDEALKLYDRATKGDTQSLVDLGPVLSAGRDRQRRLERALDLADKQRSHKEAEVKREAQIEATMNARQAQALVAALVAAVEEEVAEVAVRRAIQIRLAKLLHPRLN